MHRGVVLAEGDFVKVVEFELGREFDAYARGLSDGANLYGSGSCGVYTLDDLDDLSERQKEILRKHLTPEPA